jgi:hypothetical protein
MDGACKVAWYQVGVFAYEEEALKKRQRRQIWHSLEPHLLGGMVPGLFFFRATRDTLNQSICLFKFPNFSLSIINTDNICPRYCCHDLV